MRIDSVNHPKKMDSTSKGQVYETVVRSAMMRRDEDAEVFIGSDQNEQG